MVDRLDTLRQVIEAELRPYGSYLSMRGAEEGEQRFGIAELAMATILVAAWMGKQYLKGYLEETGKLHAQEDARAVKEMASLEQRMDALITDIQRRTRRLEEVEELWTGIRNASPPDLPATIPNASAKYEELIALLKTTGLTERAARKVASELLQSGTRSRPF